LWSVQHSQQKSVNFIIPLQVTIVTDRWVESESIS